MRGLVAPWVLDGPMNGDAFTTYVTCVLAPELSPGDVVIMDNLSSHKAPAVRAAIEAAGAKLMFLPPYSPDSNPIEMAFSKLKAHLRKAAERTIHGLWNAIGRTVDLYSPTGVRKLLRSGRIRCNLVRDRSNSRCFLMSSACAFCASASLSSRACKTSCNSATSLRLASSSPAIASSAFLASSAVTRARSVFNCAATRSAICSSRLRFVSTI